MKLRTGLNPYGLTYHLGIEARGTERANPNPAGLEGFIRLAEELGCRTLEVWDGWLDEMEAPALAALGERLAALGMLPVVSSGLLRGEFDQWRRAADALDTRLVRLAMTPILCGDRAAAGAEWYRLVAEVRRRLETAAARAEAANITLLIENHQDFSSAELVGLCEEFGPVVRIAYDTGNSFPVAEAPLDFTRTIAPYVRHAHLKDYRAQRTDEGVRLVRCAIGDGAVPFEELVAILGEYHDELPAVLEPGALTVRHIRFFTPGWWRGYAPLPAEAFAACLLAAGRNRLADGDDWRTPWERGEYGEVEAYELEMIRRSAANMKALGLM